MGSNLFGIGFGELLFLAILILIIFGPKRIPEIAQSVGRFLRDLRQATAGFDREVRQWMSGVDSPESWLDSQPPSRPPYPYRPSEPPAALPEADEAAGEETDASPPPLSG
jgi:sec-independent protein translocase protein TatA